MNDRRIPVYLLAGGRSSRLGTDKARAELAGKPQITRVALMLAPVAKCMTVVAAEMGVYDDLGFRTIPDRQPGQGPLGGLAAALEDCEDESWILLAACDWVGLRTEWAEALLRARQEDAQCVLFCDERPQPLLALYHTSLAPVVTARLATQNRSMMGLIRSVDHVELSPPAGWETAFDIDTHDDLVRAQNLAEDPAHA